MTTFFFFLFLLLIGVGVFIGTRYNTAQARAQLIEEAQSNITVIIKKRFDLINKLVDVVSSYVDHEKLTHLAVVEGESMANLAQASIQADSTLTQLNSIARNYPDLKANASYNRLMDNLTAVEAEVQSRREYYNRTVREYNTFCNSIPFMFVAPSLGFRKASFFDVANADSLESTHGFSADDGTILREKLTGAGKQVLQGTKALGHTLETHGRALLERGQAGLQKPAATDSATPEATSATPDTNPPV